MADTPFDVRLSEGSREAAAVARRDEALVRGLLNGDADCLRRLIGHYDPLVRYAIFHDFKTQCRRDPSFLDARASEVWSGFVESVRRRGGGPQGTLKSYLMSVTRNKCADFLRRSARDDSRDVSEAATGDTITQIAGPQAEPLSVLIDFENVARLRECVAKLPPDDRNLLRELELITNARWSEAAEKLGLAESTLRSRWARALERLRKCLGEK